MIEEEWIAKKISFAILLITLTHFIIACKSYNAKNFIESSLIKSAVANSIRNSSETLIIDPVRDSIFTYDSTRKYVYFTFDDGPQPGTMNCFHIVRDLDVKASFFMIATQIDNENLKKRVDSIRNSYPEILLCNHSYTHGNFNHYKSYYNNADSAARDVIKAQSSMQVPLKIFRTPANNSWNINGRVKSPSLTKQLCYLLRDAGYEVAGWDVEWNFSNDATPVQSADQMIKEIKNAFKYDRNFVRNNVVILTHDRMFRRQQYADSLRKVIATLKKDNRIVFETMDNYPGIRRK
jgi:peptidoglycan-N-acetylglucosamine deacetylase